MDNFNTLFSLLGSLVLAGNVDAVRFLFLNAWTESPPLLRTIRQLQLELAATEFQQDQVGKYSAEFLYCWSMLCIGELSPLITRDLRTAKFCLQKVTGIIPQARARLAYIGLLSSTEPKASMRNVAHIETLRKWACKRDLFSLIVLSKISFESFLDENDGQIFELPSRTVGLLQLPLSVGHPVAVRFWNDMLAYINTPEALQQQIPWDCVRFESLDDLHSNLQIRPESPIKAGFLFEGMECNL